MKKLTLLLATTLLVSFSALAQENRSEKTKRKEKDTKIKITTKDGKVVDLEDQLERLGEDLGTSIERFFESFNVDIDENHFEISFDDNSNDWEDLGERIEESVNGMLNHMDVEMTDVDPKDFEDQDFNFNNAKVDGRDILKEIEDEHNAKVKNFERIDIRIREKEVRVNMEALLDNGKTVTKTYRKFRD